MSQNGGRLERAEFTAPNWQIYYALSGFDPDNETRIDPTGQYTYQIRVTDRAGNVFVSSPHQVRIDQTAPALTLDTPAGIGTILPFTNL